ncbi:hypothetical protein LIER_15883 [Lithospermum erythrorhizon]|uniref:Retrovirus-related Pol polyprotein from transposon TNT 1-94-like beta-barrel domain-containing protein n=1 Tax=Lithospermum erythrorhizon TaxID=34254 RepID=A0AAV3Q4Y6_LITER
MDGKRVSFVTKLTEGVTTNSDWFLDSGCSRHMIGNSSALADILPYEGVDVTFGDGRKVKKDKALGKSSRIKSEEDLENYQYQFQLLQQILPHVEKEDLRSLHDKPVGEVKNTKFWETLGFFESEHRRRFYNSSIPGCWESYIT